MTIKTFLLHWFLLTATWLVSSNAEVVCKIQRSSCIVHDPDTIKNVSCWARPINRTTSVVNVRGELVLPVNQIAVNIQLFQKRNFKYKHFLVNVTEDYCQFFAKGKGGTYIRMLTNIFDNYTNLNHECPYVGHMYIEDLPLGPNNLPTLWPRGEYRLDVLIITNHERLLTMQYFAELKDQLRQRS